MEKSKDAGHSVAATCILGVNVTVGPTPTAPTKGKIYIPGKPFICSACAQNNKRRFPAKIQAVEFLLPPHMRIEVALQKKNILVLMRSCGYAPEGAEENSGELKWTRSLVGRRYPRFHVYSRVSPDNAQAILELHLDQKQPSYEGSRAHSGEYDGPVVVREAQRILNLVKLSTP